VIKMPKAKPDKVEVIRIELQESERQILRDYVTGQNVGETAQLFEGIDKLLTFENLYIGATIFEILTGKEVLAGTPNDLNDLLGMLRDSASVIFSEAQANDIDVLAIAVNPRTYTSAFATGLKEIFGLN